VPKLDDKLTITLVDAVPINTTKNPPNQFQTNPNSLTNSECLGYSSVVDGYYNYMYGSSSSGEQVKPLTPSQVGRLRDYIRENVIRSILAEIDELATQLLSTPNQTIHGSSILSFLA
jgi:hypothetical protein